MPAFCSFILIYMNLSVGLISQWLNNDVAPPPLPAGPLHFFDEVLKGSSKSAPQSGDRSSLLQFILPLSPCSTTSYWVRGLASLSHLFCVKAEGFDSSICSMLQNPVLQDSDGSPCSLLNTSCTCFASFHRRISSASKLSHFSTGWNTCMCIYIQPSQYHLECCLDSWEMKPCFNLNESLCVSSVLRAASGDAEFKIQQSKINGRVESSIVWSGSYCKIGLRNFIRFWVVFMFLVYSFIYRYIIHILLDIDFILPVYIFLGIEAKTAEAQ